jgi:hypothetical protein
VRAADIAWGPDGIVDRCPCPDHDSFATAKRVRAWQKESRPNLTWIKPASPSLQENFNCTSAPEPTGLTEGRRAGFPREALMREFLAAVAISAMIIGVMLSVG